MGKNKNPLNKYIKLPSTPSDGPSLFAIIVCFFIAPPLGGLMLFFRFRAEWKRKRHSDFSTYANIIGSRITVSISEIASKSGKPATTVISDLQTMIDKGYIANGAYIDRKNRLLVLDSSVFETVFVEPEFVQTEFAEEVFRAEPVRPEPEKASEPEPKPEAKAEPNAYNFSGNEEFEKKLREIRQLDLEIENEAVSAKIDRIGHLTSSIFRVVQVHPDRTEEVRKFMNYYLPTTFKLLKSYSFMEKQTYQGDNIAASRKKIENILDTLVHAFEQQLDRLFHSEAMDVDTDISVLETMMTSDGLIEPELNIRSVARR